MVSAISSVTDAGVTNVFIASCTTELSLAESSVMRPLKMYGVAIVTLIAVVTLMLLVSIPYPSINVVHYSPPKPHATHSGGSLEDKLHTLYNGVETFALFIGHGRSGHSLVGAILDAHPEIVIAHEFDVLNGITGAFYKKIRLFFDLHSLSRQQALFENRASCPARADNHRYCYNVPGQWQGTYKTKIKVIGDKKGAGTARNLANDLTTLNKLQETVGIPVKFIHVIRNPFDNIATQMLRVLKVRDHARNPNFRINNSILLEKHISSYFRLAESVQILRLHSQYNIMDIYSHEIVSNPQDNIRKLCNFLEVDTDEDYIKACSKVIFSKPSQTRHSVVWTAEQKARITTEMKKYPFLKRFSFYSN